MASDEQDFVVLGAEDIQDFNDGSLLPLSSDDIDKIQQWLHPTDYSVDSSEYKKHLLSHLPGTGNWILETENYIRWHESSEVGSLWIKGIPGAGKSVYAARLISKLASHETVPVLYFFFRQIITANQKPHSLIRDYLSQLLNYSPMLQCNLKKFIDDLRSVESVSFDELWRTLQSALSILPRVYCVADALDEMDTGNESFINNLIQLGQHSPASIKVLMTSRPVPHVEKTLNDQSVLQIILQQQMVDQDIAVYIDHRLKGNKVSENAKLTVLRTLCTRAKGLFLYARLMMDSILDLSKGSFADEGTLLDALNTLPTTLADMYTGMLLEHSRRSGVSQAMQYFILRWVTRAERPLRLLELSGIINLEQKTLGMSQDTKSMLRAGCGPLLEILEDETVCVIHHSFTEFLFDRERNYAISEYDKSRQFPSLDYARIQRAIAITCVKFLTSDWLEDWEVRPKGLAAKKFKPKHTTQSIKLKYPVLDYAATNWHRHVVKYDGVDEDLCFILDEFLVRNTRAFHSWLDLTRPGKRFHRLTPLHVAAHKNLSHYVEHLLSIGQDIECLDDNTRTPLFVAAMKGHHQTVAVLLKSGAQNDRDDCYGLKPLIQAAKANHYLVVKLLLEAGVAPLTPKTKEHPGNWCGNAPTTIGDTAVEYTCQYGHVETIEAFMPHLGPDDLKIALYWATRFGSTEVVMVLLQHPEIEINSATKGQTAIFLAAAAHDTTTMRILLDKGANVHIMSNHVFDHGGVGYIGNLDKREYTPLHAFARACTSRSHKPKDIIRLRDGFQMLLKAGCDVNAVDGSGLTVLHSLVSRDCFSHREGDLWLEEIVSLLINHGASATALAADGSTVLHMLPKVTDRVIDLLIQNGADISAIRKSDGKSPLMASLEDLGGGVAKELLARGADCNLADPNGWTPLHFLVSRKTLDKEVYEMLLCGGANPNARNQEGNTPLHMMTGNIWTEILALFLEYQACLEAKNNRGHTVLLHSLALSDFNIQNLVEAGADVHAIDHEGLTAMHLACSNIKSIGTTTTQLLRYLADKDVDPKRTDYDGNTLLHQAAQQPTDYHQEEQAAVLNLILDFGISPSARNRYGQTALHIAFSHDPSHYPYGPLDFLLGPRCNPDVNVADVKGIRPIHLTASFSASLTMRLLKLGADPTVSTIEGQSPLMIACRTRQSNLAGMIIDYHTVHGICAFIDAQDFKGRSALHYASRSGRHETIKILLDAGANPNLTDKQSLTPLHACAEFSSEDGYWPDLENAGNQAYGEMRAAYVMLSDKSRPTKGDGFSDPVGIRESVRLLAAYGADLTFLDEIGKSPTDLFRRNHSSNPLGIAITANCEAMVDELLCIGKRNSITNSISSSEYGANVMEYCSNRRKILPRQLLLLNSKYMPDVLSGIFKGGKFNLDVVRSLLEMEHEPGIIELKRLGADFLKPSWDGESPLTLMVRWGFVSLMNNVGAEAYKMNATWIEDTETTDVNLRESLRPILPIACERALPNLEMIKLLVEKFAVDVNERDGQGRSSRRSVRSVVHILAQARYWWQLKALEYVIERGANVEAKDSNGDTALLVACNEGCSNEYARVEAIKVLLRAGANPNVLDKDSLTCLNRAAKQPDLIRVLIEKGADPILGRLPFLFSAIEVMNLDIIRVLVASGVDCNIRRKPAKEDESVDGGEEEDEDLYRSGRRGLFLSAHSTDFFDERSAYPIHLAASGIFISDESKSKMIPIIETLLQGGADPFLVCSNGDPILHNIACQNGILEPFLAISNIDLEACDSKGRTLLLAACSPSHWRNRVDTASNAVSLLVSHGASMNVVDNEGRNALHCVFSSREENERISESFQVILSLPSGPALVVAKDRLGCTALHYALRNHSFDVAETLLQHGADPTEPDPTDGSTALHHIAKAFFLEYAGTCSKEFRAFLARGLDINARDSSGETALFRFVATPSPASGYEDDSYMASLPVFEEAGADFKARNYKGEGLLHRLASTELKGWGRRDEQKTDMVGLFKYLLEKGCDPAWEDEQQRTCLDVAAASGNQALLELFQRKSMK